VSLENYPSGNIELITLRDGSQVTLRPIRPEDAARLQEGFTHLSSQSIYMRFLQIYKELSDEQADQFSTVDYVNRMAFVGSIQEEGEEHLVGVARYALIGLHRPGMAEAAIIVRDDYQNLGLGSILIKRLGRYARLHGVSTLQATVNINNAQIIHFIERSGLPFERRLLEPGIWEIVLRLEPEGENDGKSRE
jgi:acetyltransferase